MNMQKFKNLFPFALLILSILISLPIYGQIEYVNDQNKNQ